MILHKFSCLRRLRFSKTYCLSRKMSGDVLSKPVLYGDEASPPVRAVMMSARVLGVDMHFHTIDLFEGHNKTEFYKKINPLQKVPALSINGQTICDSHAIALYLCRAAGPQDLYPTDNLMRAKVDQMLYFDATTLFPIDSAILSEYFAGKWHPDESKVAQWYSAVDYLETQLSINKWLAGDKMQLCDIFCAVTLSSLGILLPPLERHEEVKQWMQRLDEVPCFEINRRGLERMRMFVKKYGPA